jgi:hypothetical protein
MAGLVEVGMTMGALVVVGAFVGIFVGVGARAGTEGAVSSLSSSLSSGVTGVVTAKSADVGLETDTDAETEMKGLHCGGLVVSRFSVAWGKMLGETHTSMAIYTYKERVAAQIKERQAVLVLTVEGKVAGMVGRVRP